jgi:hypothetical protein
MRAIPRRPWAGVIGPVRSALRSTGRTGDFSDLSKQERSPFELDLDLGLVIADLDLK